MTPTPCGSRRLVRAGAAAAVLSVFLFSAEAAGQRATQPEGPVALRQGMIVDPDRGVAFVMTTEGGTAAVDLATGASRWTSITAAQPLGLVGNILISQVETSDGRLELVALDKESGARVAQGGADLPVGVRASVGETLRGTFTAVARPSGGTAIVSWSFVPKQRRRMSDPADATRRPAPGQGTAARSIRGALRMNLSTGALTPLDTARIPFPPGPRWSLSPAEKITGAAPAQYESADGRHVLVSERIHDDRVWEKYRWTVYERRTRRRVGEMPTPVSFSPFVVHDSALVYGTTPYARKGAPEEPAKLRSVGLRTGRELWSVQVRETVYRGPFPP